MSSPSAVESIYFAALGKGASEERAAYLDEACGDDADLRRGVERLLKAQPHVGGFLETPGGGSSTGEYRPPEGPGSRIGPYKLLQEIGEGGMGVVFMAEQEKPVRRRVALKIIKPGMDSAQVIARFEAERQALAMMDHQNIARVLDAGTTDSGRPYFVMELVHGIPITKYCDDNHLSPRERLDLFIPVCQAIQHAHQKGVIHRDIKPSNIMVCLYDGKPVPKVIDFGVAKATEQRLTERTMFTNYGTIIGTFEYMAPEQAEMSQLGVDTRSDIYSLGVLLYELLTGSTPLERKRVRAAALDEVLRLIKEEEPPKPSTRVTQSKESLNSLAAQRKTEPAKLSRLMRGELDWIVMKALEKDRTRRYDTANGLARDVQRFLADEPVEACPPSATYKLRKFARKHRAGLTVATVIAALLLLGTSVSTWQALRAEHARREALAARDAETAERQAAVEQRDRAVKAEGQAHAEEQKAKQSAAEARAVLEFFQNKVLAAGRPEGDHGGLGKDVTLRQALDAARREVGSKFKDQPVIEASILSVLGDTYWYLGERESTRAMFERALELRTKHLGMKHPDTFVSMHDLAYVYVNTLQLKKGLELFQRTIELRQTWLGPEHPLTLMSMCDCADAYKMDGQFKEAIALHEKTLKLREKTLSVDHHDTLTSMNNLALTYLDINQWPEALPLAEKSLELHQKTLGPNDPDTLMAMGVLARVFSAAGRLPEGIKLGEQVLKVMQTKYGRDHPNTLQAANNLAVDYQQAERLAEALELFEENYKLSYARYGPDDFNTLHTRDGLATGYRDFARIAEAENLFKVNLKYSIEKLGTNHQDTLMARISLARLYQDTGRLPEALPLFKTAVSLAQARYGPDNAFTLMATERLARCHLDRGDLDQAEKLFLEVIAAKPKLGAEHAEVGFALWGLGKTYVKRQKFVEAEPRLRESLAIQRKVAPDDYRQYSTQSLLGASLLGQKRYAEAEPQLLTAYEGLKKREAKILPDLRAIRLTEAVERLVELYEATGKPDEAAKWRAELEAVKLKFQIKPKSAESPSK